MPTRQLPLLLETKFATFFDSCLIDGAAPWLPASPGSLVWSVPPCPQPACVSCIYWRVCQSGPSLAAPSQPSLALQDSASLPLLAVGPSFQPDDMISADSDSIDRIDGQDTPRRGSTSCTSTPSQTSTKFVTLVKTRLRK